MEHDPQKRLLITISVLLASVMQTLDTTIANVALPYMESSLAATKDQITWVLTSYIVAAAIMTLPTSPLSSLLGRKKFFLICIVGFVIASILCGMARTIGEMVLFRSLQGVFGAALVPLSQTILLDTYPKNQHGMAMAMWGMGIMVGPIIGPTLGGYLTEYLSWHWVFFINLPVGILAFLGVLISVPNAKVTLDQKFSVTGFALISIAVAALQIMLDRGETKDWFDSIEIRVEAVIAALGFYFFIVHMFTSHNPFVSYSIFLDRNFVLGLFIMASLSIILYCTLSLLSLFLQEQENYSVIDAGLVLAPRGMATMFAMSVLGRIINKVDMRMIMLCGMTLIFIAIWQMVGFSPYVGRDLILISGIIQGMGLGMVFVPLSTMTFSTLHKAQMPEGTALFNLIRNIGASIGLSISGTILAQKSQILHAVISEHINPFNQILKSSYFPKLWDINTVKGLALLNSQINNQAVIIAYINNFTFMLYACVVSFPLIMLMKKYTPEPDIPKEM